jgi:hypothetical protein
MRERIDRLENSQEIENISSEMYRILGEQPSDFLRKGK